MLFQAEWATPHEALRLEMAWCISGTEKRVLVQWDRKRGQAELEVGGWDRQTKWCRVCSSWYKFTFFPSTMRNCWEDVNRRLTCSYFFLLMIMLPSRRLVLLRVRQRVQCAPIEEKVGKYIFIYFNEYGLIWGAMDTVNINNSV